MRRFYITPDKIASDRATIHGADARHVRNVLRSKPGDALILFDGRGMNYYSQITRITSDEIFLTIQDQFRSASESPVHVTVGQALVRAGKMDRIVRQFTELGGDRFVPVWTDRSTVKPEAERFRKRRARWQKIALESLKQCGRSYIPEIEPVQSFEEVVTKHDTYDLCIIFDTVIEDREQTDFPPREEINRILVLIGPEGGFTTDEVEMTRKRGFIVSPMGPRVLKSDTAMVAALTLIQHRFGDLTLIKRA